MAARTMVTGFALVLACTGCATDSGAGKTPTCDHPGVCKIEVHVLGCTVSPPLDDIVVSGRDRMIQWELVGSPNIKFARQNGIFLKDDPQHEFGPGNRPDSRKFKVPDKNSIKGIHYYKYGIQLMDGDTACPQIDPGIINHG